MSDELLRSLWILDVGEKRVVIDAFDMPAATAEQRQAVVDAVKSITFEPK